MGALISEYVDATARVLCPNNLNEIPLLELSLNYQVVTSRSIDRNRIALANRCATGHCGKTVQVVVKRDRTARKRRRVDVRFECVEP